MTTLTHGRWLLVALALVGLAFAIPVVSAHGDGATPDDQHPYDGDGDTWAAWMESYMNEHMGPEAVEWMESHMGVTLDEMARDMADGGHWADDGHSHGTYDHDHGTNDHDHGTYGHDRGAYGHGRGC